jgi:hypothetical protein
MNILEDFERVGITEHAHGVLFGNAFRFQEPSIRPGEFFTMKCLTSAARSKTTLVRTTDLFFSAQFVKESGDGAYARACREAILKYTGQVCEFPPLPDN